jgi:hypothetical protein
MKILILVLIALSVNSITSDLVCDSPVLASSQVTNSQINDPNDIVDIRFSSIGGGVAGITYFATLNLGYDNTLTTVSTTKASTTQASTTRAPIDDYFKLNIRNLDFQLLYKENGVDRLVNCRYDIPFGTTIQRVFYFVNLKFFTDYQLRVGYTSKSGVVYKNKDFVSFKTCFGEANPPSNLKFSISSDCKLMLQWTEPTVVNSPKVCYYDVKLRDGVNPQLNLNSDIASIIIGSVKTRTKYDVYIQSVNDERCYRSQYPFVQNCQQKTIASSSAVLSFTTGDRCDTFSSTVGPTSTTTRKMTTSNANGVFRFNHVIQVSGFFIAFLYIF